MKLQDELPIDHHLATVYRYGAGLCGVVLIVFGCLGFAHELSYFGTNGQHIAGLSSNGALSTISLVFGVVLLAGAAIGGNTASTVNLVVGALFILSGFVNLGLLGRSANILGFRMPNVLFSFVMGLLVLTFGMYGRVSGHLHPENPYWRARHPDAAAYAATRVDARATAQARIEAYQQGRTDAVAVADVPTAAQLGPGTAADGSGGRTGY